MKNSEFDILFEKQIDMQQSISFDQIRDKIVIKEIYKKRHSNFNLKLIVSLCFVLLVTFFLITLVKYNVKEYKMALSFFNQNELVSTNLTKTEIKKVYEDIITNEFKMSKTREVLLNSISCKIEEYNINIEELDLVDINKLWKEWVEIVISESDNISVYLVFNDEIVKIRIDKGNCLAYDDIPHEYKEKIIGCYYDENFTNRYCKEILGDNTYLYFKLIKTGSFDTKNSIYDQVYVKILLDIQISNIEKYNGLYFLGDYDNSLVYLIQTNNKVYKEKTINGCCFYNEYNWYIIIYRNGKITNLDDIYDLNNEIIINKSQLYDIYECFNEFYSYTSQYFRKFYE